MTGLLLCLGTVDGFAAMTIRSGAGLAAATVARDQFRADIGGGTVAGANGSFGDLRREITWDGVPDIFSAPHTFPLNFFNVDSPRGALFSTPGTGFQVSASAASGTPVRFGNLDPTYPAQFVAFSPERLFTPLGQPVTDITFFVPGTNQPATVSSFGAMFTDVDVPTAGTVIVFFGPAGQFMGGLAVPPSSGGDVSFAGATFTAGERIGRVRIASTLAPGPGNHDAYMPFPSIPYIPSADVVAIDDLIYSEPAASGTTIPALSPLTLLVLALTFAGGGLFILRK
jgi:hypothetical protein